MTYKLIVQRILECKDVKKPGNLIPEDSTLSTVNLVGEDGISLFKCFCCENIGPSTDTPKQDKRIVAREYKLSWTSSGKNASLCKKYPEWLAKNSKLPEDNLGLPNTAVHVRHTPAFDGRRILIHVGNYPQDTEGCLLFGTTMNAVAGTVSNSVECIKNFFTIVRKLGIKNILLEIKEIEPSKI